MIKLERVTSSVFDRFAASGRFVPEDEPEGYLGGWFVIPPRGYVRWVGAEPSGMPNMRALEDVLELVLRDQLEYQGEVDFPGRLGTGRRSVTGVARTLRPGKETA